MNKASPPGYGGEPVCQQPSKQKSALPFCKNCNFKSFALIPLTRANSYFPLLFLFVLISHPHLLGFIIIIAPRVCSVMTIEFSTHASNCHRTCFSMQLNKIKNKTIILLFIGLQLFIVQMKLPHAKSNSKQCPRLNYGLRHFGSHDQHPRKIFLFGNRVGAHILNS